MAAPRVRHAARVLLLDEHDRVLLVRVVQPSTGLAFWFAPGGGLKAGEDARAAAAREVAEETGLRDVSLEPEVWRRRHVFTWRETEHDQRERWFPRSTDLPTKNSVLTMQAVGGTLPPCSTSTSSTTPPPPRPRSTRCVHDYSPPSPSPARRPRWPAGSG